ncbi:SOS response-associated peptidase family protein, partial [Streptomyces sp. KLMMK]|uniref:SOS response-associated peptidase n=1 Tax=Streptomyces sp. KLMMK TaxID=3109353 RepID=UPI00300895DC
EPLKPTEAAKAHKQPYYVSPRSGEVMAMAGLYEFWRDPEVAEDDDPAALVISCSIITAPASDDTGHLHPRMPLAIAPEHRDMWLDPATRDPAGLRALLAPPASGQLDNRPVSRQVNSVRNDGGHLLAPA